MNLAVMTPEDLAVLEADRWFGALPQERRAALLDCARPRAVAPGTRVYGLGDPPNGLWVVLEGQVRLVGYPAVGMESVARILGAGTWFGELSTLDGGPRPHDAIAFGPARLLHIPLAAFEQLAERQPAFWRDIGLLVCAHQRRSISFMAQSIAQPVAARLARILGAAARSAEGRAVRIRQEDLAAMIGVSRQTTNKTLRQFQREGLVALDYGQISILDPAGLRATGQARR
ncbi:MAG: Crp/Fnr family transcriptional regulator [Caulobacteraceae bacterium]|nr:Crp/Fnr family transcriptional regulator [Caulobacteraceae bacterium]